MKHLNKLTDQQLVALYVAGCNKAFDILLTRYQARIFSYIISYVKDRNVADDIFQDTFLKAINTMRSGSYTENGKFSAWILRIARNLVIDYFREEKSKSFITSDIPDDNSPHHKSLTEDNIEQRIARSQTYDDIRRLIHALPDAQKEIVRMRYYEDISFKEIAERTNISINTALGRMRYALINMKKLADTHRISLTI